MRNALALDLMSIRPAAGEAPIAPPPPPPSPYTPAGTLWDHRDLPAGAVAAWDSIDGLQRLAQANSSSRPAKNAGGVDFDGSAEVLFDADRHPRHVATHILGDDLTCTGITRAPDGTWWIVGHSVGQTHSNARLFHYSADLSTRLGFVETAVGGIQGLCYDADDDTLWAAAGSAGVIHFDLDANVLGSILPSDTGMAWASAGAVAIDQANGRLIVMEGTTGSAILTVEKFTKAVIASGTFAAHEKDHIFFDPASRALIATAGANNSDGNVILLNMDGVSYVEEIARFTLPQVQAIEGIYYADGKLWVCDDQHFHGGPSDENAVHEYDCGTILGTSIAFFGALSYSSVSPTDALFVLGEPVYGHGSGVYVSSTTQIQLRCAGDSARAAYRFDGLPSLTSPRVVFALIDTVAGVFRLWVDGRQYTHSPASSGSIAAFAGPMADRLRVNLGAAFEGSATRFLPATVKALGYRLMNVGDADERQEVEGWLAHEFGLTANLPSGHPYKTKAP